MNEKIREIAEQAYFDCDIVTDIKIPKEFVEKFGQAIIRECFETILDHKGETSHRGFAYAVLNRFGVEE